MANVVLVTGAGASHNLGVDAQGPPLMGGWAGDLLRRLGGHAALVGLQDPMDGPDFEERLGAFLRFTRSLPDVAPYPTAGLLHSATPASVIEDWFREADQTARDVMEAIFGSLHDLFGGHSIHAGSAETAFGPLLMQLHADPLIVATTNYDIAAEIALLKLHRRPYAGVDSNEGSEPEQELHYRDLLDHAAQHVPVLHLHGRVGWYRQSEDRVIAGQPDAPYNPALGTPALLLPERSKLYDDTVSSAIWEQFRTALAQAERVMVLGHSLNDPQLLEALRVVPDDHLAVTIHARPGDQQPTWGSAQESVLELFDNRLPHVIPMDFRASPSADHQRLLQFLSGQPPAYNAASSVVPLDQLPR